MMNEKVEKVEVLVSSARKIHPLYGFEDDPR
jgi:hypothetical protein